MNRKGFTLIELLAAITVIALISTVGVISYTNIIAVSADKVFNEYQDSMYVAAANYMMKNYNKPGVTLSFPVMLSIDDLDIETFKNPKNEGVTCKEASYVLVNKNVNCEITSFKYDVCLKCGDDFDNCKKFFYDDCTP